MIYFVSLLLLLLVIFQTKAQNNAPVLVATGNQVYCPLSILTIVTNMSITNSSVTVINNVYIQISEGYVLGQDVLLLTGIHPNISASWNNLEGKLTLSGNGSIPTIAQFENAVEQVVFTNPNANASGQRTFSITIGEANYLESTGHYYQYIPNIGITWNNAKIAAENSTYYGLQGYLATITSMDEVQITSIQASGAGWIGGNDVAQDNVWRWVTGPENGTIFWNGLANGTTPNFAFWNTSEPNNFNANESYAHVTAPGVGIPGSWNDLSNTGDFSGDHQPKGYIVEYGGMPGDPVLQIATTITITIPKILTTTNNNRCGAGTLILSATSVSGNVAWFAQASGGNPIFTGNLFETPLLNNTTAYYVQDAATLGCNNITRSLVTATIINLPTIPPIPPITICEGTIAFLTLDYDFGNLRWFTSMNSTAPIFEGNSFETPPIFENTVYYVEAVNNNCVSARVPYQIQTNPIPEVTDETVFICQNASVTLNSGIPNSTYLWSNNETTESIVVNEAGTYSVTISNEFSCSAIKNFEVLEVEVPIIQKIETTTSQAIIQLENEGDYLFSIDGNNFSPNNVFNLSVGGLYTAYVKGQNDCGDTIQDFVFISIPSFFTHNNDGNNDFWLVRGVENFRNYRVAIFDRFGKLLFAQTRGDLGWDGTFNEKTMPASDYWYLIEIQETNQILKGNFSLIR